MNSTERTEVAKTSGKLEELNGNSVNENRVLTDMVAHTRGELNRLQHELVTETAELNRLKRDIEDAKKEAKYVNEIERQKFMQSLEVSNQALQAQRHSLELLDLELVGRTKDVEALEAHAKPIADAMQKLQDERIAIEQQRVRNQELVQENDRLSNEVGTRYEEVRNLETKFKAELKKVQAQAMDQEHLSRKLEKDQKDVGLQVENLEALKSTLDPKLAEMKKMQEKAESDRGQAKVIQEGNLALQAELDKRKSDLAILSSQLEAKGSALLEFDQQLKQLESEVRVKVQQAEVAGIKVSKMPEHPIVDETKPVEAEKK